MKQLVLPAGARQGRRVELTGREFHYLARVRRVAVGEELAGLDAGRSVKLRVVAVHDDRLVLDVTEELGASEPTGPRIVLYPFLLKARKLDDVIRQACEAGVSTIVPVQGDHCIAKADDEDAAKKVARWNLIAKEAAQQSGNHHVTEVRAPIASRTIANDWDGAGPLLVFHQTRLDKASLHGYLNPHPEAVALVVGPEGGLSDPEVTALRAAGAVPVWLGPFVLRAETASVYALGAVNTILQESSAWTTPT